MPCAVRGPDRHMSSSSAQRCWTREAGGYRAGEGLGGCGENRGVGERGWTMDGLSTWDMATLQPASDWLAPITHQPTPQSNRVRAALAGPALSSSVQADF